MSRLSLLPHSRSKSSLLSDSTYHSFHDIELYEPVMSSGPSSTPTRYVDQPEEHPASMEMRRQDSGYESLAPRPSQPTRRRTSTTSSSTSRPRTRLSIRRAVKSGPVAHLPRTSIQSLYVTQSNRPPPTTFFHFPSPDPPPFQGNTLVLGTQGTPFPYPYSDTDQGQTRSETPTYPIPPQTTHYWTSDRTRRLEYAAIDAASRGVKGWMMRHMVPECFVPKERRRIGFEDDRGSVRRYRLELETEESAEKDGLDRGKRKKGLFWGLRA